MAETITHTWQTVEQAAVTLNVSTRTIARRLAGGSLESRVDENGRRLVLVQQMSPGGTVGDTEPGDDGFDESAFALAATGSTSGLATSGLSMSGLSASLAPSSQGSAVLTVLQSTVAAARDDARSARRGAKFALAGMMVMAGLIVVAAALISSTLTRTTVTTGLLREQLAETKGELKQTQAELMATRTAEAQATRDLVDARRTVETTRRLAAPTPVAAPATQPTLIGRVAALFGE